MNENDKQNKRESKTYYKNSFTPTNKYKDEKYLREILNHMTCFTKKQAKCVWYAFRATVEYMFENGLEFDIQDFVSCKVVDVKSQICPSPVTPDGTIVVPPHKKMKFVNSKKLKDYLNGRGIFKNINKLTRLPNYDKKEQKEE